MIQNKRLEIFHVFLFFCSGLALRDQTAVLST